MNGQYDANGKTGFVIPELGYNHRLSSRFSLGVASFGNGGLNTTCTTTIALLGSTNAGVDLQQLFVMPTLAWKASEEQAFGIAVNVLYQRFKATGLQNFASPSFSTAPASVTDKDYSSSVGAGVRLGYLGQFGSALTLGATWQSETKASPFDEYAGLFAQGGDFDVPANFAFGLSLKATPAVTVGLDVQRILYGGVPSIANSGSNRALLGTDGGPGFGWQDITVVKAGIAWKASDSLVLRGGYNHSGQPIPSSETFFNLLAPGVVQHHATLGLTWRFDGDKDLNVAYVHAFERTLRGVSSIPPTAGGGNANLRMYQDSVALSFGWSRQ